MRALGTSSRYPLQVLTLDEYKKLIGPYLVGLSEKEIKQLYELDTTLASFSTKTWIEQRRHPQGHHRWQD
jgi:hypothetical protein